MLQKLTITYFFLDFIICIPSLINSFFHKLLFKNFSYDFSTTKMIPEKINNSKKIKVCIIGGGAAGLCTARHLAVDEERFEIVVFERGNIVGGTWIYMDTNDFDSSGSLVHSSMYKNLRTNLPKEIMSFPDFPIIGGGNHSAVGHEVILEYLGNYAKHFKILPYVKFQTNVESVEPVLDNEQKIIEWKVRTQDLKTGLEREYLYDAIFICNGHYSVPHQPQINGIETFNGKIMHSHNYRKPTEFSDKIVFLLGASSSGIDIAIDLSHTASIIYLSHWNERLKSKIPKNVHEVAGIDFIENNTIVLTDGSRIIADVFMFCTGYNYNFPFLGEASKIKVEDNFVQPLYKHIVNIEYPSMFLIGIPAIVVPFPLFDVQVRFSVALLNRTWKLPSNNEMMEELDVLKHLPKRHAHRFGFYQWAYLKTLCDIAKLNYLPEYYEKGYTKWSSFKSHHLTDYKSANLQIRSDENSTRTLIEIVRGS